MSWAGTPRVVRPARDLAGKEIYMPLRRTKKGILKERKDGGVPLFIYLLLNNSLLIFTRFQIHYVIETQLTYHITLVSGVHRNDWIFVCTAK